MVWIWTECLWACYKHVKREGLQGQHPSEILTKELIFCSDKEHPFPAVVRRLQYEFTGSDWVTANMLSVKSESQTLTSLLLTEAFSTFLSGWIWFKHICYILIILGIKNSGCGIYALLFPYLPTWPVTSTVSVPHLSKGKVGKGHFLDHFQL